MLEFGTRLETKSPAFPWYFRCPSASNPADGPSRGQACRLSGYPELLQQVASVSVSFVAGALLGDSGFG
eukprot:6487418-Amphidinium_carterae.1